MARVTITNRHGQKLAAHLDFPQTSAPVRGYPAVLMLHGFTGFKDEFHLAHWSADLVRAGFVVLRFDAAGIWESEGTSLSDFVTSRYIEDAVECFEYLLNVPEVDPSRVGVCGHSLGGQVALFVGAQHSLVRCCAAIQAPESMLRKETSFRNEPWRTSGVLEKEYSAPATGKVYVSSRFLSDAETISSSNAAAKLKCPLLVIYGTQDDLVEPYNAFGIFEAAVCPKELVALEGASHVPEGAARAKCGAHLVSFFRAQMECV